MMTDSEPHVLYEKRDGIAYVTLNRPDKRNAFSPEMLVRLCDVWQDVAEDREIRVALVTGAGDQAFLIHTHGDHALNGRCPVRIEGRGRTKRLLGPVHAAEHAHHLGQGRMAALDHVGHFIE